MGTNYELGSLMDIQLKPESKIRKPESKMGKPADQNGGKEKAQDGNFSESNSILFKSNQGDKKLSPKFQEVQIKINPNARLEID